MANPTLRLRNTKTGQTGTGYRLFDSYIVTLDGYEEEVKRTDEWLDELRRRTGGDPAWTAEWLVEWPVVDAEVTP